MSRRGRRDRRVRRLAPSRSRMVGTGRVPEGNRSRAALHPAGPAPPGPHPEPEKALRLFMEVERRHPREPHWYLALLATDPSVQGRGLGTALLAPVLEQCAREGIPVYTRDPEEGKRLLVRAFGLRRGKRDHASGDTHGLVPGPYAFGLMVCTGVAGASHQVLLVVGLAGFEPATSGPPDQRANQPAPQPGKRAS